LAQREEFHPRRFSKPISSRRFWKDAPDTPTARLMLTDKQTLRDVVDAIDRGASDDRVVGMIARIGAAPMGMAQTQEIRDAVQDFARTRNLRSPMRKLLASLVPAMALTILATAFDQIYLQPSGDVGLTGIIMESPFIKGTLAKLGVTFHGDHRYEYKNALNFFTDSKYTGPHKEAMTAIMNSWFNQMKGWYLPGAADRTGEVPVAGGRRTLSGPGSSRSQTGGRGCVSRSGLRQSKKPGGRWAELLYLDKYLHRAGRPHDHGKDVALVFGVGGVTRGKSDYDPVQGSQNMGSDTSGGRDSSGCGR